MQSCVLWQRAILRALGLPTNIGAGDDSVTVQLQKFVPPPSCRWGTPSAVSSVARKGAKTIAGATSRLGCMMGRQSIASAILSTL